MVTSVVNTAVEFEEPTDIEPDDLKYESFPYSITFDAIDPDNPIQVVFGQLKTTWEKDNVSYWPMYYLNKQNTASQIGVMEVHKADKLTVYEDGEIIPDVKRILLYSFVTKGYLKSLDVNADTDVDTDVDIGEPSEDDEDDIFSVKTAKTQESKSKSIFSIDVHKKQVATLPEESKEDARLLRKAYNMAPSDDWIVKFMQNRNYKIHDTNDCFFAVIFHAFNEIGENITVDKLKGLLADEMTDEIYQNKRKIWLEYENLADENNRMIGGNKTSLGVLKKRVKSAEVSTDERKRIIEEAKKLKEHISKLTDANRSSEAFLKRNLQNDMRGVNSFAHFQDFVRSNAYTAEAPDITILEHVLNVKFVVLSEDSHAEGATDSILECGRDSDARFSPNFYILVSRKGNKYNLVTYKDKKLLTFREIPYDIKMLILNKCMERNAGNYNYIQDFRNLKSRMGIPVDDTDEVYDYSGLEHDPNIVFMIHTNSQDTPAPGCGCGEHIPMEKTLQYMQLAKIPKWRKKLHDSWPEAPFTLGRHRWASAENHFQAAKYANSYPDFAAMFSADSTSQFSKDPALAKLVGGKGKHPLKPPHVKQIDKDFYGERSVREKYNGLVAKFEQNLDLTEALLATRPAVLMQFNRGKKPDVLRDLMSVRDYLASKNMR